MEVIRGNEHSNTYSTVNRTTLVSGSSGGKKRIRKIHKKGHKSHNIEGDDEDGESFEKIITKTKTKIVYKKRQKAKKTKGVESNEYDYEEYEDDDEGYDKMSIIGVQSMYMSSNLTVTHRVPKSATCTTWNGNKIKTFDGLIFTPNLDCTHTMVKDRIDGTFGVFLQACPSNHPQPCPHTLEILMSNNRYVLGSQSKIEVFHFFKYQSQLLFITMYFFFLF